MKEIISELEARRTLAKAGGGEARVAAHVATAATEVTATTAAEVAAATTTAVLGISQTGCTRYRQTEQQGSDCPYNARCIHFHHPVIVVRRLRLWRSPARWIRRPPSVAVQAGIH